MRTTVRLDEHLLAQARPYAAESGRTLTAVIEEALPQLAPAALQPSNWRSDKKINPPAINTFASRLLRISRAGITLQLTKRFSWQIVDAICFKAASVAVMAPIAPRPGSFDA